MSLTNISFTDKVSSEGAPPSGVSVFVAADANDLKRGINEINALLDNDRVVIGNGADGGSTSNTVAIGHNATANLSAAIGSVAIGEDATATLPRSVAIGKGAQAVDDDTYGGTNGNESVAIGELAKAYAWRAVAIGGDAQAAMTSATAIGAGAVVTASHGVALGRGAWCPGSAEIEVTPQPNVVLGGSTNAGVHVYFANSWANNFDTPISGIVVGPTSTPSDHEISLHGKDAFDARSTPSETNKAAGHLGLHAGISTGTGLGGEVRIYNYPAGGVSNNTKNTEVMSAKFDSASSVDTRFFLLDVTDGTMKRVEFGADDSAGAGFKTLKVAN